MHKFLEQLTEKQRKLISWLGFFALIGVGILLVQNPQPDSSTIKEPTSTSSVGVSQTDVYARQIETRLGEMLSESAGVGQTQVFVTLDRGSRLEIANEVSEETRTTQPSEQYSQVIDERKTVEPVILRVDGGQREIPLVIAEEQPIIRGVLVISEGADDPSVRLRIAQAVQAVLQISLYRIEVLPRE